MRAEYRAGGNEAADTVLVAMVAEVMLVCATALCFFVEFSFPVSVATGAALAVLFAGSLLCWKSQAAALAILALSLLAVEAMLVARFPIMLLPFALADIVIVMVVSGAWHAGDQPHS